MIRLHGERWTADGELFSQQDKTQNTTACKYLIINIVQLYVSSQ